MEAEGYGGGCQDLVRLRVAGPQFVGHRDAVGQHRIAARRLVGKCVQELEVRRVRPIGEVGVQVEAGRRVGRVVGIGTRFDIEDRAEVGRPGVADLLGQADDLAGDIRRAFDDDCAVRQHRREPSSHPVIGVELGMIDALQWRERRAVVTVTSVRAISIADRKRTDVPVAPIDRHRRLLAGRDRDGVHVPFVDECDGALPGDWMQATRARAVVEQPTP